MLATLPHHQSTTITTMICYINLNLRLHLHLHLHLLQRSTTITTTIYHNNLHLRLRPHLHLLQQSTTIYYLWSLGTFNNITRYSGIRRQHLPASAFWELAGATLQPNDQFGMIVAIADLKSEGERAKDKGVNTISRRYDEHLVKRDRGTEKTTKDVLLSLTRRRTGASLACRSSMPCSAVATSAPVVRSYGLSKVL